MDVNDFKEKVNLHHLYAEKNDHTQVVVQVEGSNIGGTPCVGVKTMFQGFDWDHGKLIIVPSEPLVKKHTYSCAEKEFIVRAIERGYKYICRFPNGDILISEHIPVRTTRSWKYDKKISERTSLYRNDFKKLRFENGGVMSLSCFMDEYKGG